MTNWKKVDAAVDAAFRRLQLGQLPHCGARKVIEPCVTESGEGIFMCDFGGERTACKSCGAERPGGEDCFSVSVPVHLYGLTMTPEQLAHRAALAAQWHSKVKQLLTTR